MDRILVVDDEKNYLVVMEDLLTEDGYQVMTAESGEEALAIFRDTDLDLVLTDMKMPAMSGIELLSKIKEAEGVRQASILHAEGDAEAIRLVNEAANKYFIGNAQLLRKLQALESALENNAKIVIPTGSDLVNIIGDMAGIVPLNK